MGRRKLEMKRIEDKSSRQVTFSKRRSGLFKKARELSILCDVDIAVVIFSNRGRLYEFSNSNSLANILERYWNHCAEKYDCSKDANGALLAHGEFLNLVQSLVEEPNIEHLTLTELVQLEKQLDMSLSETKARKSELMLEYVMSLHGKEKLLGEENELLQKEVEAMEKSTTVETTMVDPPLQPTLALLP